MDSNCSGLVCKPSSSFSGSIPCCNSPTTSNIITSNSVQTEDVVGNSSSGNKKRRRRKERRANKNSKEVNESLDKDELDELPSMLLDMVSENETNVASKSCNEKFLFLSTDESKPNQLEEKQKVRKRKDKKNRDCIGEKFVKELDVFDSLQCQWSIINIETRKQLKRKEKYKICPVKEDLLNRDEPLSPNNLEGERKKKSTQKNKSKLESFEDYLTDSEVQQGLKNKTMIFGPIRINQRCYKEAYVSEGVEKDIIIEGMKNRNRALEGDEVVILLNTPDVWKPSGQRTGKVVYILDRVHSRSCIGKLPDTIEPTNSFIVFSPRDSRVPRIKLSLQDKILPASYLQAPHLYGELLFRVKITDWTNVNYAKGKIIATVGHSGDVEVQTLAIMMENNLDPNPLNPSLNLLFPSQPYTIPKEEISNRLDLRKECIFTIDPATARDLDDAVSATQLANGNIEVGVHISDVTFFLNANTPLDHKVSRRATTVYLVQRVYHMLPVELCQMCSLTPLADKLAFSVFVELTPDAQVISHRFARTVIHSCTKLAYEHAQNVIDNPEKTFKTEDFPEIGNGFTVEDCVATIKHLFKLSLILRYRRFESGALQIDQPKLCFHLDPDTQAPLSSFVFENKESHRLIEEFMLLANMMVAKHIYTVYPSKAFLRRHLPPRINMIEELQQRLEQCGIHLDISNAGTVHSSILKYSSSVEGEDANLRWARYIILNNLCAKPMLRAEYFCPDEEYPELHHYALNAPYYTHFTSPIRRYADIMVHRLLAASLDLGPQPCWRPAEIARIARTCNRQKQAAKVAGEQSSLLFLALFLTEPVETAAAVLDVKDRSMDVVVKAFGVVLRVYTDPLPVMVEFDSELRQLHIRWNDSGVEQFVQLFSVVRVLVSRVNDGLKLSATLLPPLAGL